MTHPLPADDAGPRIGVAGRVAAALGGIVALLIGVVFSFGTVLLAPVGVWITRRFLRHGREPGLGTRWVASTVAVGLAIAVGAVYTVASMPSDRMAVIRAAQDSALKQPPPPPPAWLERLSPRAGRAAKHPATVPPRYGGAMLVYAAAMGVVLYSCFLGTLGWLGGVLLSVARRGRWPAAPRAPVPGMAEG